MKARFIKNTIYFGIGNALNRLVSFVLIPIYTKYLSQAEYGLLEIAFSTVLFLEIFLGLGFDKSLIRYYQDYKRQNLEGQILSTTLFAPIAAFVILLALGFAFAGLISDRLFKQQGHQDLVYLILLLSFFRVVGHQFTSFYRASANGFKFILFYAFIFAFVVVLNTIIVIYCGGGISAILMTYIAAFLLISAAIMVKDYRISLRDFSFPLARQSFYFGFPLVLSMVSWFALRTADRYFLLHFRDLNEVAVYGLAFRMVSVIQFLIIAPFQLSYPPHVFSLEDGDKRRAFIASTFLPLFVILASAGLLLCTTAKHLVLFLATPEYVGSARVATWLVPSIVLSGLYYWSAIIFHVTGKTRIISSVVGVVACMTLVLNYFLVPRYGVVGTAISANLSSAVIFFALLAISRKHLTIPIHNRRKVIACAVLVLAVFLGLLVLNAYEMPTVLQLVLLAGYFLALYKLNLIQKSAFMQIVAMIRRKMHLKALKTRMT